MSCKQLVSYQESHDRVAARALRVAAALRAASRLLCVFAAFRPAARRLRVIAAFLPAALRRIFIVAERLLVWNRSENLNRSRMAGGNYMAIQCFISRDNAIC